MTQNKDVARRKPLGRKRHEVEYVETQEQEEPHLISGKDMKEGVQAFPSCMHASSHLKVEKAHVSTDFNPTQVASIHHTVRENMLLKITEKIWEGDIKKKKLHMFLRTQKEKVGD